MAYQTRTRDPLLEENMQAALRRRAIELFGLGIAAAAIYLGLALWNYSPNDPNFLNATSNPVTNAMGTTAAMISGTLIITIGLAAWSIPIAMLVIAGRMIIHKRDEFVAWRSIFVPVFVAVAAVFMSTNAAPPGWTHSWGLGGFAGDAALEILVDLNPISIDLWIRVLAIGLGVLTLIMGFYSTAFSWSEIRQLLRMTGQGTLLVYSAIITGVGFVINVIVQRLRQRRQTKQDAVSREDGMPAINVEDRVVERKSRQEMGRKTLFPTLPVFARKNRKDVEESEEYLGVDQDTETNSQRVKRRIADAIQRKQTTQSDEVLEEHIYQASQDLGPQVEVHDIAARLDRIEETGIDDYRKAEPPITAGGPINIFAETDPEPTLDVDTPQPSSAPTGGYVGVGANVKTVVDHTPRATMSQSSQAKEEAQPNLFGRAKASAAASADTIPYEHPALSLLSNPKEIVRQSLSDDALTENARMLENVLDDYGVKGEIVSVRPGPVVTMYELEPAPGLKASRVIGLSDDIARSMSALSARVSTVPGRTVIGIELPNETRETVLLREILSCRDYGDGSHALPLALGKDIGGAPVVADLSKMPHLLIAGTTGSGKSVAINTMILSLLYKLSPDECRMIMVDPKMLELSVYDGIPHLLSPVVTDPKKAVVALKWVVGEMEERYRKMSKMGVRNVAGFNSRVEAAIERGEDFERTVQTGFDDNTGEPLFETETFKPEKLPYIVVVVDEMADLMMVAGKEIEACIQRLAQMARASGIHLIMATQRPSVDVITGTIKANFPTRISFQVTSKVDSRTILGEMGAEQLLGMGDNLYMAGGGKIIRTHAPFVSDEEVEVVVNHLKIYGPPEYVSGVVKGPSEETSPGIDAVLGLGGNTDKENALYDQAVAIVAQDRKCSTSYIQRKLSIGYNKAAKLVEEMEENGIVSAANHVGKREILLPEQ